MKDIESIYTLPVLTPRDYQLPAFKAYSQGYKTIIISAPRRAGKDFTSLSIAIDFAIRNPDSTVVLLAPSITLGARIWLQTGQSITTKDPITGFERKLTGCMLDVLLPKPYILKVNSSTNTYYLKNGSIIRVQGSLDTSTIVGQRINCCVLSEVAMHSQEILPLISPILMESKGLLILNGTVTNETSWFTKLINNSQRENLKDTFHCSYLTALETQTCCWVSPIKKDGTRDYNINPHLLTMPSSTTGEMVPNIQDRLDLGESESYLIREYLNIPTDVELGSYYSDTIRDIRANGQISNDNVYDPDMPVFCSLDLGVRDSTAITFFQVTNHNGLNNTTPQMHFIEAHESTGESIEYYINYIKSRDYVVSATFVPHDSNNRSLQTGINLLDYVRDKLDFTLTPIQRSSNVVKDIQIVKGYLKHATFDEDKTSELITALTSYRENVKTGKPLHLGSDAPDSLRYACVAVDRKMISAAMLTGWNGAKGSNTTSAQASYWAKSNVGLLDDTNQYPNSIEAVKLLDGASHFQESMRYQNSMDNMPLNID